MIILSREPFIEEVAELVYRVQFPLPKNPLKYINSYFIVSDELLIIDTALNHELAKETFKKALKLINSNNKRINFFLTHMHADHTGLLMSISSKSSTIYTSKEDAPFVDGSIKWNEFWENSKEFALKHGFPPELANKAILHHPGYLYGLKQKPQGRFKIVKDGDILEVGHLTLKVISTPGHTPGHLCLYDKKNKILFSGDHVLEDITPNIAAGYENQNPLAKYLSSLEKIKDLDVKLVLAGHRKPFSNLKGRIKEIEEHHKKRLNEIKGILSTLKEGNAYSIASMMDWDINYSSFDEFPISQKWFAHCEAIAHILYLRDTQEVEEFEKNGVIYFRLS